MAPKDRRAVPGTIFPHLTESGEFHRVPDSAAQRVKFHVPDIRGRETGPGEAVAQQFRNSSKAQTHHAGRSAEASVCTPCNLGTPPPCVARPLKHQDSSSRARATFVRVRREGRTAIVPLSFSWRQVFRGNDGDVATASFEILRREQEGHQSASAFGIYAQRRTTPVPRLSKTARFRTVTCPIDADCPPGEIVRAMLGVHERCLREARHPVTIDRCEFDEPR